VVESKTNSKKKGYIECVADFFREIKKVIWPTPRVTFKNTWITLFMIFLVGAFVWLIDVSFQEVLRKIMSIS